MGSGANISGQDATTDRDESLAVIADGDGTGRQAEVLQRSDGVKALAVDARVIVETTFGIDPIPDSAFRIINTGGTGDTWTIDIAGTPNNDPSAPDRDLPAYQKIFTVLVGEVGDEIALRDRIITELNNDTTFKDTVFLKADSFTDRAMVHITSTKFSAFTDEFYSRPNAGDFDVTVTGTASVDIIWDDFIPRSKPVSLARDPDNPHIGVFGISGSVSVTAKDLDDLFIQYATDDGTPIVEVGGTGDEDMLVNGSGTPQTFFVSAQPTTDIFIQSMIFRLQGNGIKLNQFGAKSGGGGLSNGITVQVKSDNIVTDFLPMRTTADFKNRWAALSGTAATWELSQEPGADEFLAIVSFENPFIIKIQDAFGAGNDDYINVTINDNIQSGNARFDFLVRGFEKEP